MSGLWQLPLLFGVGLVAGFVDSVAGGGGLITIPVLLNLGLGPQQALGTNKLQAAFGSGSASWHYAEAGDRSAQGLWAWIRFFAGGRRAGHLGRAACRPAVC